MARKPAQRLEGSNRSANIAEALSARVKDPLWFLARQWQSGAFEAEPGGSLTGVELETRHFPVKRIRFENGDSAGVTPDMPLEAAVEAERPGAQDTPGWRAEALEYRFALETTGPELAAEDYGGFDLDWHHFDIAAGSRFGAVADEPQSLVPTQLNVPGAPDPRWWRLEASEAYFDSPEEAEPNALTTLLPEFFYTDIDNWYLIPAPMPAGSVREVVTLTVTDSFCVTTELSPAADDDWRVFSLDARDGVKARFSENALFAPNIAIDILDNEVIEEVRFVRDEQANLVWAWEQRFADAGETVINGDGLQGLRVGAGDETGYRFMSDLPPNWIPYVARQTDLSATNGEIHLRRGRTDPAASLETPQYRSKIVEEAVRLNEEEIPRTGLRVRRLKRFAVSSTGEGRAWVGRHKDAGRAAEGPGLKFDYVAEDDAAGGDGSTDE